MGHLVRRGHQQAAVETKVKRAQQTPRQQCLEPSNRRGSNRLPMVVTYHPLLPNLSAILRSHHPLLLSSERLARSNPEPPLISFRRPPNLRDLLVHARLSPPSTTTTLATGTSPCGGRGCKTCGIILPNNATLASHKTGKQFTLSFRATCKTADVVYLLQCAKCGMQYVGETGQPLHMRINGHRGDISNKRLDNKPVAQHFCTQPHHTIHHMQVAILDVLGRGDSVLRKIHESRRIREFGTAQPYGMNFRIDSL